MQKKNKSISKSVLIGCAVFIILLSLALGGIGFLTYYNGMIGKYETYLHDALTFVNGRIDGDDMEKCLETGEKSESYEEAQELLNQIKDNYDIQYIYIVKPLNLNTSDNMQDVLAGVSKEEAEENLEYYSVTLGRLTGDYYSPDIVKYYLEAMNHPGEVLFFSNKTDEFGYVYTGLTPVVNSDGESVAILAIDLSMGEIARMWKNYSVIMLTAILLLVIIFLFFMYNWFLRRVIRPLQQLKEVAAGFVQSSHGTQDPSELVFKKADIHTGDEMEALSDSLTVMFEDMRSYMTNLLKVTAEKERIGAELNVATQIQADMLPRIFPAFPGREEFDLYASMNPAKEVGGDFYDFFLVDDDHLCMVMADVSGKGVPAALFMVIAKTLIKNRAMMGDSPSQILGNVNEQLCEGNDAMLFVTVWLGILTISTGKGVAANAGHEHPVLKRADGKYELVEYRHSPAVATMEGIRFREHEFEMNPGDVLFVYTDGVPEATDANNELFGNQRMLDALNKDLEESPKEALVTVRKAIDDFVGEAPQFDDITMLCMKYTGPTDSAS